MTAAPAFSESDEIEVGEEAPVKPRSTRKRKSPPHRKVGGRNPEEIDTWDPPALAWRAARYREVAALAVGGTSERQAVRALVRRRMDEDEAKVLAGRGFEVYPERWDS
jgi:hypothetical protein